jgi:RNA polymerase sigma factor (sigma-70 family)
VDLLQELPRIREYRALPKWLMQTCYHKCLRQQQAAKREVDLEPAVAEQHAAPDSLPEEMLAQLTEEQTLRDLVAEMPNRCRQMIHMLFFEIPARPYEEIAKALGLATGSIGFIRGRCLSQLRKRLEKIGF